MDENELLTSNNHGLVKFNLQSLRKTAKKSQRGQRRSEEIRNTWNAMRTICLTRTWALALGNAGHNAPKIKRPRHNAPKLQNITPPIRHNAPYHKT